MTTKRAIPDGRAEVRFQFSYLKKWIGPANGYISLNWEGVWIPYGGGQDAAIAASIRYSRRKKLAVIVSSYEATYQRETLSDGATTAGTSYGRRTWLGFAARGVWFPAMDIKLDPSCGCAS